MFSVLQSGMLRQVNAEVESETGTWSPAPGAAPVPPLGTSSVPFRLSRFGTCPAVAEPLRFENAGWAFETTPAAEIAVRKLLAAPASATTVVPMTPDAFLSWKRRSVESVYTFTLPAAGLAGATMFVTSRCPAWFTPSGRFTALVVMAVVPEPVTSPESVMVWFPVRKPVLQPKVFDAVA